MMHVRNTHVFGLSYLDHRNEACSWPAKTDEKLLDCIRLLLGGLIYPHSPQNITSIENKDLRQEKKNKKNKKKLMNVCVYHMFQAWNVEPYECVHTHEVRTHHIHTQIRISYSGVCSKRKILWLPTHEVRTYHIHIQIRISYTNYVCVMYICAVCSIK